ncbi:hypothetical protein RUM44_002861 [Polyplax serrata]|uniref:Uncharacterized protein n=1 Tax=Polyplax serrata TaxID=468196 RepID=A0ABR1AWY5_POLSC
MVPPARLNFFFPQESFSFDENSPVSDESKNEADEGDAAAEDRNQRKNALLQHVNSSLGPDDRQILKAVNSPRVKFLHFTQTETKRSLHYNQTSEPTRVKFRFAQLKLELSRFRHGGGEGLSGPATGTRQGKPENR